MTQTLEPVALRPMTREEAHIAATSIRARCDGLRASVVEFYERRGWKALGYKSWRECVLQEFNASQAQLYRALEAGLVEREISPMGETGAIPERTLRPLTRKDLAPNEQREAYERAREAANGAQPTGAQVQAAVDEVRRERQPAAEEAWPDGGHVPASSPAHPTADPTAFAEGEPLLIGDHVWWEEAKRAIRTGNVERPYAGGYMITPTDGAGPDRLWKRHDQLHAGECPYDAAPHGKCPACGQAYNADLVCRCGHRDPDARDQGVEGRVSGVGKAQSPDTLPPKPDTPHTLCGSCHVEWICDHGLTGKAKTALLEDAGWVRKPAVGWVGPACLALEAGWEARVDAYSAVLAALAELGVREVSLDLVGQALHEESLEAHSGDAEGTPLLDHLRKAAP